MNTSSPKKTAVEKIFAGLLKCQHKISYNIAQRLKPFQLTRQQFEVLSILNKKYPETLNVNAVKAAMHDTMPDISRIATRLNEKGYVQRLKKDFDKRNTEIALTDKGHQLMKQVRPLITEEMRTYFNKLSEQELNTLHSIMKKIG